MSKKHPYAGLSKICTVFGEDLQNYLHDNLLDIPNELLMPGIIANITKGMKTARESLHE